MRLKTIIIMAPILAAIAANGSAAAAGFVIGDPQPARDDAYASSQIAQPWVGQQPTPRLVEKPMGELIAARLGLVDGHAELFRFRMENAPSEKTMLNGVVDGGGIRLKLTW